MKKLFTQVLCMGLLCSSLTLSTKAQTIPEVLYYKFDGSGIFVPNLASGATAATDSAILMGSMTQGGSALCSGTLIGTGVTSSTDYLNTNWTPDIGGGAWTISFRTNNIVPSTTLWYIFGEVGANGFRCFTNGVAGANNWILRGAGLTDVYINGGAITTPTMATFVYDPTLGNVKGYLNGVLVTTVAQGAVNLTGTSALKVGAYGSSSGLNGNMDEFMLFNRALSDIEVAELYNPYYPGFLGTDQTICPGDTQVFDLISLPYSNVLWSNGATTETIAVSSPDTFIASLSGTCSVGSDTIVFTSAASFGSLTTAQCDSFVAPSGMILTSTGAYNDTIPNAAGCDSIISIDLTILMPTTSGLTASDCYSVTSPSGSFTWDSTGVYTDTIPNAAGCDSIITVNVTIDPLNLTVNQSGYTLTAQETGVTYQWIDCATNTPIGGATLQSYTATANGDYAVIINGLCTDTSACTTVFGFGLEEMNASMVQLYPNPSNGIVTLQFTKPLEEVKVEVINALGQSVFVKNYQQAVTIPMQLEVAPGIYQVVVSGKGYNRYAQKLVVK